jgi:hypothetical protein
MPNFGRLSIYSTSTPLRFEPERWLYSDAKEMVNRVGDERWDGDGHHSTYNKCSLLEAHQ